MIKTKDRQRRQKGEGSFVELPNGKYKMVITVGQGLDGKQKRRSITCNSKQELMEKVSLLRLDKTPLQAREITFGQLYKEYEREALRGKADGTIKGYGVLWNRFQDELADVKLSRINTNYISNLLLSMKNCGHRNKGQELKNNTLLLHRRLLSAIFNFAIAKGYIDKNPCVGALKGMKEEKKADLEVISEDALKQMLEDAKKHDIVFHPHTDEIHWYALILFAVSTGMRRGEILGLRKSSVDMENGIVDIRVQVQHNTPDLPLKTKNAYRKIRVDKEVLALVMADSDSESEWVFANRRTHKNLSMDTLSASFSRFQRFYDNKPFQDFTFHNFRHYNATRLLIAGVDVKTVSRRLGHADVQTTLERYAHWIPEVDERARSIVGANLIS